MDIARLRETNRFNCGRRDVPHRISLFIYRERDGHFITYDKLSYVRFFHLLGFFIHRIWLRARTDFYFYSCIFKSATRIFSISFLLRRENRRRGVGLDRHTPPSRRNFSRH